MFSAQASRRAVEAPNPAQSQAMSLGGSFRNRTYNSITTAPTPTTAGMALIPMAMKLQARTSGIFFASFSIDYTGWMATETTSISIQSLTAPTNATFSVMTFATSTLVGPPGLVGPGVTGVIPATATAGARVSSAAAGIVVTGGAGSLTQVASGTLVQGTAASTFSYSWSGIISNTVAATAPFAEVPFTIGNEVVLTFTINHQTTAGAIATAATSMLMYELP